MNADDAIAALARRQHGLFTRSQARKLGFSDAALEWRLACRRWVVVHRGVYRLPGTPATWEQSVKAACLLVNGVASHRSAATLLAVPGLDHPVEVTVEHSNPRLAVDGITVHRSRSLEWADRDLVDRIPVTSVSRTVIDLAAVLDQAALEAVLDHVLAARKVPLRYLSCRLDSLGTRGRAGTKVLATLIADRRGMRHFGDSEPQRDLLRALLTAGLPMPLVEFPVTLPGGAKVYIDAAYPASRLAIEVDSYRHHSSLTAWSNDHARTGDLLELGWRVLPITTVQLRDHPAAVVRRIARILGTASSGGDRSGDDRSKGPQK